MFEEPSFVGQHTAKRSSASFRASHCQTAPKHNKHSTTLHQQHIMLQNRIRFAFILDLIHGAWILKFRYPHLLVNREICCGIIYVTKNPSPGAKKLTVLQNDICSLERRFYSPLLLILNVLLLLRMSCGLDAIPRNQSSDRAPWGERGWEMFKIGLLGSA